MWRVLCETKKMPTQLLLYIRVCNLPIFYITFQIIFLACTTVTSSILSVAGFLLEDDCPAPPPCTCTPRSIDCDNGDINLSKVPIFRNSTTKMTAYWYLLLRNNSLSTLPNGIFDNLHSVTSDRGIDVSLQRNNLSVDGIGISAFRGIADSVLSLNLTDNNLTSIPLAIGNLKRLQILYLKDNPIKSIDSRVFRSLRNTLGYLEISLPYVTKWPDAMHYLTSLGGLEIKSFYHTITDDAFSGFRSSLTDLRFRDVSFTTLPSAVCKLHNLRSLSITNDMNLDGKNFIYCNPSLKTLKKLIMSDNHWMTTFPQVFTSFPNLTDIEISGSGISFIDDNFIPNNTMVSTLKLTQSNLTTLPGAVNKFTSLYSCDLKGNKIRLIERHSIYNILNLGVVYLDNNPIIFISKDAFLNVPKLVYLGLSETLLTQMPLLVETLPSLTIINLEYLIVSCNCEMPRIEPRLSIYGSCGATNETISHYVKTYLPKCP